MAVRPLVLHSVCAVLSMDLIDSSSTQKLSVMIISWLEKLCSFQTSFPDLVFFNKPKIMLQKLETS